MSKLFIPPLTEGYVTKVYDGDSITIESSIPGMIHDTKYLFKVRLNRIDTPELRTNNEEEKEIAILARDALNNKILNKNILLKNISMDKYGRLLCDIFLDNICINDWMIENRYAVPYFGKTKKSPKSWKDYFNNIN